LENQATPSKRSEFAIIKAELLGIRSQVIPAKADHRNEPQCAAVESAVKWLLFGGSAGGGKTETIIIKALTKHKRSVIYRRQYKQGLELRERLAHLVTLGGGEVRDDKTEFLFRGRLVHFRSLDHWNAVEGMQGNAYDLMAFDEATQFPKEWIEYLSTWNRSTDPNQLCQICLTSNPPTTSEGMWLREFFSKWVGGKHANPAQSGEIAYFYKGPGGDLVEVPDLSPVHVDGKDYNPFSMSYIFSSALNNPYLGQKYYDQLDSLPEVMRRAFKFGDWTVGDTDSDFQLIPTDWIFKAIERGRNMERRAVSAVGADVATASDESALAYFDGYNIQAIKAVPGSFTSTGPKYLEWLKASVIEAGIGHAWIMIDPLGVGSGPYDNAMIDPFFQGRVIGVNFAESAAAKSENGQFNLPTMKSYCYWHFRSRLNPERPDAIGLPDDPKLILQLRSIMYELKGLNLYIEPKDKMKSRVGFSPDRAEACIYAVASEFMVGGLDYSSMGFGV
jgi:hypothetical protein